jgi:nitroreductase
MSCYQNITTRRTIRQFGPDPVPRPLLEQMVNAGRLAPSAANRQPLEFVVVDRESLCGNIFPHLKWAGYIAPAGNPLPGQEPKAYIVVLVNLAIREKAYEWDSGAAIENILLTAWEAGVGSCWIISADKPAIGSLLGIPKSHRVDSVIALGYPAETPVVEDLKDSVEYWKDESGRLHVPKRPLESVLHFNGFSLSQAGDG